MKKILVLFTALLCTASLFAMNGKIETSLPNQFVVSWKAVKGAVYYDVYVDKKPVARLDASTLETQVGSDASPLASETEYQIIIAARDGENKDLDATQLTGRTTSWDGIYSWKNKDKKKDNKGKCQSITMEISGKECTLVQPSERHVITPIPISDTLGSCSDGTPVAAALMAMVGMFNTTDYEITEYQIFSDTIDPSGIVIKLETVCMGFHLQITAAVRFLADSGTPLLQFSCRAKGLYDMVIFKNPEKKSDGVFTLRK
jgi:hypothetical protein